MDCYCCWNCNSYLFSRRPEPTLLLMLWEPTHSLPLLLLLLHLWSQGHKHWLLKRQLLLVMEMQQCLSLNPGVPIHAVLLLLPKTSSQGGENKKEAFLCPFPKSTVTASHWQHLSGSQQERRAGKCSLQSPMPLGKSSESRPRIMKSMANRQVAHRVHLLDTQDSFSPFFFYLN